MTKLFLHKVVNVSKLKVSGLLDTQYRRPTKIPAAEPKGATPLKPKLPNEHNPESVPP
jgi:hypothetical protein